MAKDPRPNRFPGKCRSCGRHVAAGAGYLSGSKQTGWTVDCGPCIGIDDPIVIVRPAVANNLTSQQQDVLADFQEGVDIAGVADRETDPELYALYTEEDR